MDQLTVFRNLKFYRIESDWPDSEEETSKLLESAAFEPCGPLTERSSGWIPVFDDAGPSLARRIHGAELMLLRTQSRVLPAAAINEALVTRIEDYKARMGEAPGARLKRRLKAEVRDELLPKSLVKSDRVWGYVDIATRTLVIDTLQPTVAERFLRRLKAPFGDLVIKPLTYSRPVDELMVRIFLGNGPDGFSLGRECRMTDASDPGSVVRWANFDLADATICAHVAEGMRLTQLALKYDNVVDFVLDENGNIRKLRFAETDRDDQQDPLATMDADFVLSTGVIRSLLKALEAQLGGFD